MDHGREFVWRREVESIGFASQWSVEMGQGSGARGQWANKASSLIVSPVDKFDAAGKGASGRYSKLSVP